MEIAEFVLKMFTTGFLIAGILGMILQTMNFNAVVISYDSIRLAIDYANAAAAAPCLAQNVKADIRKGVIDSAKLANAKQNFCLKLGKPHRLTITEIGGAEIFSEGNFRGAGVGLPKPLPVLIKNGESYSQGVINVEIG